MVRGTFKPAIGPGVSTAHGRPLCGPDRAFVGATSLAAIAADLTSGLPRPMSELQRERPVNPERSHR